MRRKAGLRKGIHGEDDEAEGTEVPGILLGHMPCVSFLFFLKDFPHFYSVQLFFNSSHWS